MARTEPSRNTASGTPAMIGSVPSASEPTHTTQMKVQRAITKHGARK